MVKSAILYFNTMKTDNKIGYVILLSLMGMFVYLDNGMVGEVIATTTAVCSGNNVTCQLQPVLQLLDFMPLVIAKVSPIVIPLVIVIVVATVIIAVGSIPVAVVLMIVHLTKGLTGKITHKKV